MSQNIKYLITAGCSFSQVPNSDTTWPVPLGKALNVETEYNGRGACGNGLISKAIIHRVSEALKTRPAEELLVGIMWSGFDRFELYQEEPTLEYKTLTGSPYYCNPQWVADIDNRNYIVINPNWHDKFTKTYIENFYDQKGSIISSLENILRVQWFLKLHKVKYFMSYYSNELLRVNEHHDCLDIKHLYDLIDWNEWLDVKNMDGWAKASGLPYRAVDDVHPSTDMHQLFVDTVILPHLIKKGYHGNT